MRSKHLSDDALKAFVVVLDHGDEVMAELVAFARREHLRGSQFTGIGAFSDAVIAFFDWSGATTMAVRSGSEDGKLTLVLRRSSAKSVSAVTARVAVPGPIAS